jgi:putative ABC transport system permease protein
MIVSDAFAREHLSGLDPVGQRLSLSRSEPRFATIVGVVGATRHLGLDEAPRPDIYRPLAQYPMTSTFLLAVRTPGDPTHLADLLRQAVGSLDPALPVENIKTMEALVGVRLAERRFYLTLLGLFAALAAALAATGIYGVMAYVVSQGRREIGIRLALGARTGQVRARLLRQGLAVVAAGAVAGIAMARGLSGSVPLDLFEITMTDMPTYVVAAGALVAMTAIACWLPTRRAAAVNPVEVLKD